MVVEISNNSYTHDIVRIDDIVLKIYPYTVKAGNMQVRIEPMGIGRVRIPVNGLSSSLRAGDGKASFTSRFLPHEKRR